MSHHTVVWAFEGSFRKKKEKDQLARRKDSVGKREVSRRKKDVVQTVLQSGPLRLRAVIIVTLC